MTAQLERPKTRELYRKARELMPLGVSSNFRYWGDERTLVFSRGEGCYVYDADDNKMIDYRLAFGPIILGHSYGPVVERVNEAMRRGTLFAGTHPLELKVAERIIRMCPGVEKVRFANSGTEATMHALRIARAYTGREKVIKFEGQYHGFHDYLLYSTATARLPGMGSPRSPISAQISSGVPDRLRELCINLPFNNFELLQETVDAKWGDIAAIIVEPIMGNCTCVMPEPGWLELIRDLCDEYGIMMIMDEVKTGFRVAKGGAQELFGVLPDLATYAKSLANGFPLAAIGGTNAVMGLIEEGGLAHGGTYCGNVVGAAAADATLEILETGDVYEKLEARGKRLMEGLGTILSEAGVPAQMMGVPAMFGFAPGLPTRPIEYRKVLKADWAIYEHIAFEAMSRGLIFEPDGLEPWFTCYEHTDAVVEETLNIFRDAVQAAKQH